jgi:phosphate transport system substrate-binding protein
VLHIPTVFGGIVIAYNVAGLSAPLNFSPEVIGKIYTGQIKNWNDAAIKADNPNATLPDQAITVAHRSDGSGTTNAFTSWLCGVSADWKAKVSPCSGKEVTWPVGLGGQGNPGVTSTITTTPGAVGYIELAYAIQNKVAFGNVKNKAGKWITPSLESVAAAAKFDTIPADLTFKAWDTSVADGYPITAATWILVYQQQDKASKDQHLSEAVVHFLVWALDKGGDDAKALGYAVLPDTLKAAALAKIATITWNGASILDSLYK